MSRSQIGHWHSININNLNQEYNYYFFVASVVTAKMVYKKIVLVIGYSNLENMINRCSATQIVVVIL